MEIDKQCNDCGSTEWKKVFEDGYPEHRRDRDQTTRQILVCKSCGSEARRFIDGYEGIETLTGALR